VSSGFGGASPRQLVIRTIGVKNPLLDGIRVWPVAGFKNHLIFYRVLIDEIEVVRVIHGSRD
jgi:plasmid stabilization system protein ParE